jgi:hypothetical protein
MHNAVYFVVAALQVFVNLLEICSSVIERKASQRGAFALTDFR